MEQVLEARKGVLESGRREIENMTLAEVETCIEVENGILAELEKRIEDFQEGETSSAFSRH
jgi:hypothetical protein